MNTLNEQQKVAVEVGLEHRAVCINAGPGSGKTHSMTYRVKRLIEQGVSPDRIVLVTLTKNAANTMWERIVKLMPDLEHTTLKRKVCTIHALCYRIWRKHVGKDKTPEVLTGDGQQRWILEGALEEIIASVGFGKWFSAVAPGGLLDWINRTKQEGLVGENARAYYVMHLGPSDGGAVHESLVRFNKWLQDKNYITFADMLLNVDLLLRKEEHRKNWDGWYVIVDEAQDTTAQSMRILSALAAGRQLWMVGDIAQSLFEFAGANPEENLGSKFEARYPEGVRLPLQTNYRSTRNIIDAANKCVRHSFGERES